MLHLCPYTKNYQNCFSAHFYTFSFHSLAYDVSWNMKAAWWAPTKYATGKCQKRQSRLTEVCSNWCSYQIRQPLLPPAPRKAFHLSKNKGKTKLSPHISIGRKHTESITAFSSITPQGHRNNDRNQIDCWGTHVLTPENICFCSNK